MRGLGLQFQVCNSVSVVCRNGRNFKISIFDPRLQTKYPKKLLFSKNKKTFSSIPMRGRGIQYQVCNSIGSGLTGTHNTGQMQVTKWRTLHTN